MNIETPTNDVWKGADRAKIGSFLAQIKNTPGEGRVIRDRNIGDALNDYLEKRMPEIPKIEVGAPIWIWSRFGFEYNIKYDGKESTKTFDDIRTLATSFEMENALPDNLGLFFQASRHKGIQDFFNHVVLRMPMDPLSTGKLERCNWKYVSTIFKWVENWNAECGGFTVRRYFEDWFADSQSYLKKWQGHVAKQENQYAFDCDCAENYNQFHHPPFHLTGFV